MGSRNIKSLLSGDVAWDIIKVPGSDNGSRFDFVACIISSKYSSVDISVEYRLSFGDEWKNDAVLSLSSSGFIDGNKIRRISSSTTGIENRIRWEYLDNGIASGQTCEMRLRVLPSMVSFSRCGENTYIESHGDSQRSFLECAIPYSVVGIDRSGNFICIDQTRIVGVNKSGEEQYEITGLSTPSYACEKEDGNFIIADPGSSMIIEATIESVILKSWGNLSNTPNPQFVCYDDLTGNLLITDKTVSNAYEVTWEGYGYGTILWEFGQYTPGSGLNQLNQPYGISYDLSNRSIIAIADEGNDRLLVIDRTNGSNVVSEIKSVEIGGGNVDLLSPSFITYDNGQIFISKSKGDRLLFGETRNYHPTLSRENINSYPQQYRNIVFSPISPPISGGAT